MRAKWLLGLVFLVVGGIFYHTATNVSRGDIVAYNQLTRPIHLDAIKPGDILSISHDNDAPEVLCNLEDADRLVDPAAEARVYFNSLGNILPPFDQLIASVAGQVETLSDLYRGGESGDEVYGIAFKGSVRKLRPPTDAGLPSTCDCKMAEKIRLGQKVCMVNKVLTEDGGTWQAVGLAKYANIVPRQQFEACDVSMGTVPLDYFSNPPKCHDFELYDWDVKTRAWLKLIEVERIAQN
ncbi:hypothetical protein [Roseibium sp. MB-4]